MGDKTEIEVTIGADGTVRIVTHGLQGQACLAETAELEKAMGTVLKRDKTSEFYQTAQAGKTKVGDR